MWSLEFGVSDLNSVWRFGFGVKIWIWCKWFEFGVSDMKSVRVFLNSVRVFFNSVRVFLNSVRVVLNSVLVFLNSVWTIWILCKWLEFSVSISNSVWVICILRILRPGYIMEGWKICIKLTKLPNYCCNSKKYLAFYTYQGILFKRNISGRMLKIPFLSL